MYTIPIHDIYTDVNDMVMCLTRVAYTASTLIMDMTSQIMNDSPIIPWEPDSRLYGKKSLTSMTEMAVDKQALEQIYTEITPRLRAVLTGYFTACHTFDCGIAVKGRQLIILTSDEIGQWEKIYGKQYLLRTRARGES